MDSIGILLVGDDREELALTRSCISSDEFRVSAALSPEAVVAEKAREDVSIVILHLNDSGNRIAKLIKGIRDHYSQPPIQLLVVATPVETVDIALKQGADDFLRTPVNQVELQCRLKAAALRLRSQYELHEEADFFRKAVRKEEELSSKILDQHLDLKQAFEKIESINRELTESNKELEQIARYDTLSGLLNRKSLLSSLDMEMDRAIRTKTELAGMMVDIDNFKAINDNYGHLHGDAVIAEIGRRMMQTLRKYDHAGRYGGEEFFIVLPNTNIRQAFAIAERFRRELEEDPVVYADSKINVTASFGISQFRYGETRDTWLERADDNMYSAKKSGRNMVVAR